MSKTKVFIFTGPIAASKSFLRALVCGDIGQLKMVVRPTFHYVPNKAFAINFDQNTERMSPERTIDRIIGLIKAEYLAHGRTEDIIIDGWFSFGPDWWKCEECDRSLKIFGARLGNDFELIPVIMFRHPDEIIGEINKGIKTHPPNYREELASVYRFLFTNISTWVQECDDA